MRLPGSSRTFPLVACLAALALGCPQPGSAPPSGGADTATADAGPAAAERRSTALEELIQERLVAVEAAERGVEPEALLEQIVSEAPPVTDAEVQAFFDENAVRLEGYEFSDIEPAIRGRLETQRQAEASATFLAALGMAAEIHVLIEPPRVQVEAHGPFQGPADAPVTIVEFSDYQCPFCKRAEPALLEVLERYPDEVKLVYRHFPLDSIHPDARPASEAAACADEQGKFWPFHLLVFERTPELDADSLVAISTEVGLDVPAFETCVSERRFQTLVQEDFEAGSEAGVNGTPAFFINGILLSGARSLEDFVEVIEAELNPS